MALEIGRVVGHLGVADGVGFVESIVGKIQNVLEDGLGSGFRDTVGDGTGDAALRIAVDKGLLLGHNDLLLFLGDGAAHIVRLTQTVAAQLAEDLNDLLLIDDAAVGDGQDRLKLGAEIGDFLRMELVVDEARDGIHGARSVEGDDSRQILDGLGLHVDADAGDTRRFQLEHAGSLALREHFEALRVVVADLLQVKARLVPADLPLCVVDDGQVAQTEKIHLQKAQLLDGSHGELGHDGVVVASQRHVVRHGIFRNDHAGGVGGGVSGHALQGPGGVDELFHALVAVVKLLELGRDPQCLVQGHVESGGNELGHRVSLCVGKIQHPSHVAHGGSCRHGAEGDDLRHPILAVFPRHIVDNLTAPRLAEVHVNIGHTDSFRVEKALEIQAVFHRIDVGDVEAVGHHSPRRRASSRPHGDLLAPGVGDKIRHDEEIVHISHFPDHGHLIFQTLPVARRVAGIAFGIAVAAQLGKPAPAVIALGVLERGQMVLTEGKLYVAAVSDYLRILNGLELIGKQRPHLLLGFDVKLLGLEAHPVGLVYRLSHLDAHEHILKITVLPGQVVGIVGHNQRQPRILRKAQDAAVDLLLLRQAVILHLKVKISLAEDLRQLQRIGLGALVVSCTQSAGDPAGQTGRQGDQTPGMLPQQVKIHAGLDIKAIQKALGYQIAEIFIARLVFAQQHQMLCLVVHAVDTVGHGAGCHIDLAADDGLNARRLGSAVEVDNAIHDAVVRNCHGGLSQLGSTLDQLPDTAGAVEQAVFRMHMKMYK